MGWMVAAGPVAEPEFGCLTWISFRWVCRSIRRFNSPRKEEFSFAPLRLCVKFHRAVRRNHPQENRHPAAQAGHLSDERPVRHGYLRRQGARPAQTRQPVFPSVAAHGLGPEVQRAGRGDLRFRFPRRPQRTGGVSARRQAHQGISSALQRQFPRRQTVSDAQGEFERPDPELHLHPVPQGRRRAVFRAVLKFRRLAQHAGAGAAAVQSARLPRRSRRAKPITSIASTRI